MDNRNYPTPKEITDAIHHLITSFDGKYPEMAKRLDPTSVYRKCITQSCAAIKWANGTAGDDIRNGSRSQF
ncbi:hypothetical protein [Gilliamella mensalis]|uniref:hypothetical protein n=1 Tax=Gilliamella mensalis TaxID=1908520 RepID=UPI001ABFC29E|nr:hypothetical protein [Gilliamella mensalis]